MPRFVTIYSHLDLPMAELAKSKLESEGIFCHLANKYHIGVNWLYSQALGGVKVQVHEKDEAKAKEILNLDESSLVEESEIEFPKLEKDDFCSKCGSTNLSYINNARKAGALALLLNLPLIFFGVQYKCKDCGHKMKKTKN